jgi:hypothetical protein
MTSPAPVRSYIRRSTDEERKAAKAESSRKFREKQRALLASASATANANSNASATANTNIRTTTPTVRSITDLEYDLEYMKRSFEVQSGILQDLALQFVTLNKRMKVLEDP